MAPPTNIRTIPAWVQDCTTDDLPLSPPSAHGSRWIPHVRASQPPSIPVSAGRLTREELDAQYHFTIGRAHTPEEHKNDWRRRRSCMQRAQFTLLRNPFVPLLFRFIVFTFSAVALALAAAVLGLLRRSPGVARDASTYMAIVVDAIAIVYTVPVTYDEYFSKPIGLRTARSKLTIVLFDLIFIIFQSANLSLAFAAINSTGGYCDAVAGGSPSLANSTTLTGPGGRNQFCNQHKSLAAVLLIALVSWILNFVISAYRLVERIPQD